MSLCAGPVLKYPGAKWNMAKWIVNQIPPHRVYVEPFFGSGAVFFTKKRSLFETINDLDGNVVNLFKVLRERRHELAEMVRYTPWARKEYTGILPESCTEGTFIRTGDELEDARRFLVRMHMGFGSKTSDRTGWRNEPRGKGRNSSLPRLWKNLPARMLAVAERLMDAQIECMPAVQLLERYRYPEVCICADPPYPMSTKSKRIYSHEMTNDDHLELLDVLDRHPGPVLLSGYSCSLYDERLKHWVRRTKKVHAESGRIREEVLWLNPVAARYNEQLTLFSTILE